ncbi:MAG TPA: hypothetical protein VIH57_09230 [Bacteroidales bacterium]
MRTNQIRAEVFNLEGEKVYICRDFNNMDLSKLVDNVYLISYVDSNGNVLWNERFVKVKEVEYAHAVR